MPIEDQLEQELQGLIIDICEVLWSRGYQQVSVGGIMRLVGVDPERAKKHDDEIMMLDNEFEVLLEVKRYTDKEKKIKKAPSGITIH
jgi:hypothetical protein